MQKQILHLSAMLIIPALAFLSGTAYGQCTPDAAAVSANQPGIFPDPGTGIPDASLGSAYSQTFTVIVPSDTTVNVPGVGNITATVNTMKLNSVNGLPPGLSYTCDNSPCSWNGGSNGCFVVSGTPTQSGTFQLAMNVTVNVESPGFPPVVPAGPTDLPASDIATYDLVVSNNTVGYQLVDATKFSIVQNQPNPFVGKTKIMFTLPSDQPVSLEIFDMIGNKVRTEKIEGKARTNQYEFSQDNLLPGVYFYAITAGRSTLTNRMVVGL